MLRQAYMGIPLLSHSSAIGYNLQLIKGLLHHIMLTPFEPFPPQTGRVDPGVYIAYATKALRGAHVPVLLLIQVVWQGLQIASDWWLAHSTSEGSSTNPRSFIGIYALLALSSGVFVLFR
jgi:hypothetical protein